MVSAGPPAEALGSHSEPQTNQSKKQNQTMQDFSAYSMFLGRRKPSECAQQNVTGASGNVTGPHTFGQASWPPLAPDRPLHTLPGEPGAWPEVLGDALCPTFPPKAFWDAGLGFSGLHQG